MCVCVCVCIADVQKNLSPLVSAVHDAPCTLVRQHFLYTHAHTIRILQALSQLEARIDKFSPSATAVYKSGATRLSSTNRRTEAKQEQQQRTRLLATSLALTDETHMDMSKAQGGRWLEKWANQRKALGAHHARMQGLVSINAANEPGPENQAIQNEVQVSAHALLHESGSQVRIICTYNNQAG